jgi:hypothetical protein
VNQTLGLKIERSLIIKGKQALGMKIDRSLIVTGSQRLGMKLESILFVISAVLKGVVFTITDEAE